MEAERYSLFTRSLRLAATIKNQINNTQMDYDSLPNQAIAEYIHLCFNLRFNNHEQYPELLSRSEAMLASLRELLSDEDYKKSNGPLFREADNIMTSILELQNDLTQLNMTKIDGVVLSLLHYVRFARQEFKHFGITNPGEEDLEVVLTLHENYINQKITLARIAEIVAKEYTFFGSSNAVHKKDVMLIKKHLDEIEIEIMLNADRYSTANAYERSTIHDR